MKFLLALTTLLTAALLLAAADAGKPQPLYIDHDLAAFRLAKGGLIASAPGYSVLGSHREKPGQVEVHEKETDIVYVTDGQATFIMGGTMTGGRLTRPGQYLGEEIRGGQTHYLSKGDVLVIPAGTPHWFSDVQEDLSYTVVRIDPSRVVKLK